MSRKSRTPRTVAWVVVLVVLGLLNGASFVWSIVGHDDTPPPETLSDWLWGAGTPLFLLWLALMIWGPPRLRAADPSRTAVARPAWWIRLASVPMAAFAYTCLGAAWGMTTDRMAGPGGFLELLAVASFGAFGAVCAFGTVAAWWIRETLSATEATVRIMFVTHRIERHRATSVEVTPVLVRTMRRGERVSIDRLRIEGLDHRDRPVAAGFDSMLTDLDQAMLWLDVWVRERPELVQDDLTRALFETRGVLEEPATPR